MFVHKNIFSTYRARLQSRPTLNLPYAYWILLTLCPFFWTGCAFDNDEEFYPVTETAIFLMEDEWDEALRIAKFSDGIFQPNFHEILGFDAADIDDISGDEERFWIASARQEAIYEIDPKGSEIRAIYDIEGFSPHYIQAGSDYLLVSDTSRRMIGLYHIKDRNFITRGLECVPGVAGYRSGKFYIACDETEVIIFHEVALAQITTLALSNPIKALQNDNRLSVMVTSRRDTTFEAAIDYNTNAFFSPETEVAFSKIQYSPYGKQQLGKEFLRNVSLQNGRLSFGSWENVSDFEMDFFEARVFFIQSDSLFSASNGEPKVFISNALDMSFRKSWFDKDFVGK